jgi:hypothetical protein
MMAIAIGLFVASAQAAEKQKSMGGTVVSIKAPVAAAGTTAATKGKLVVANKNGEEKPYDLADDVSIMINGAEGKLTDIGEKDKIRFKLNEKGEVSTIMKGHAKKPAN